MYNFCVPSLFGLEGLISDELKRLNMENVKAENGRVTFSGEKIDIARANINLRTGERVLIIVGDTFAPSFDALYEGAKSLPWENFIPVDGAFPVKGHALNSSLHSIPDCQKIIKKAVVDRLKSKYKSDWFPETGAKYQIQFSIMNDNAIFYIDTSGAGLHKRGYRLAGNAAPLRETLAAAMVKLSRYRGREYVCDPFCGSGTIPIEAALAATNRAPGLRRAFDAQNWIWLKKDLWDTAATEARDHEFSGSYEIYGGDIDPKCIDIAKANARRAGVEQHIKFEVAEAADFAPETPNGIIITNPPYGERVMEKAEAEQLYRRFGSTTKKLDSWKMYILSLHVDFEHVFGKQATKKRKLYNGMIKCNLFMYY